MTLLEMYCDTNVLTGASSGSAGKESMGLRQCLVESFKSCSKPVMSLEDFCNKHCKKNQVEVASSSKKARLPRKTRDDEAAEYSRSSEESGDSYGSQMEETKCAICFEKASLSSNKK